MRKIIKSVIGILLLVSMLTGCSEVASSSDSETEKVETESSETAVSETEKVETESSETAVSETEKVETTASAMQDSGTIGEYTITIKSCTLTKNMEDKPSVIVAYDYTNNSDEAVSFMFAVSDKVYQSGIECSSTISAFGDDTFNSDNQMKDIRAGATLEVQKIYLLNDATSDIEVEVSELFSFSDDKQLVTKTFKLQ